MSKTTRVQGNKITETITRFNDSLTTNTRNSSGFTFAKHFLNFPDRLALLPAITQDTDIDTYYALEYGDYTTYEAIVLGANVGTKALYGVPLVENPVATSIANATFENGSWLFKYKDTAFYYNGTSLNYMNDITGTPAETTAYKTLVKSARTKFDFVRPFIHPTDSYAYFFGANTMYQLTDEPIASGVWTAASATIPNNLEICSACPFGEYIAIFAKDKEKGSTWVYIWDRSLTLETFVDVKQWVGNEVIASGTINGNLTGISTYSKARTDITLAVSVYTGQSIVVQNELTPNNRSVIADAVQEKVGLDNAITYILPRHINGKLYFGGFNEATNGKGQIYEVDENFEIRIPYDNGGVDVDDFIISELGVLTFLNTDNQYYYQRNVGAVDLTTEGEYITTIFDGNNGFEEKQPDRVRAWHSPIMTGGSVKIEYWCVTNDPANAGGWVTIGTNSTAGSTRTSFNRVTSTGENMNTDQEFYYRITADRVSFIFGFKADSHFINTPE